MYFLVLMRYSKYLILIIYFTLEHFAFCVQNFMKKMKNLSGVSEIVLRYDSFIIDQWGVLHDGKRTYANVNKCLSDMAHSGKKLILLSNSSKRKSSSIKGLINVGILPELFEDIVTSGELGWKLLKERKLQFLPADYSKESLNEKLKVFVIGNGDDDEEYIGTCGCEFVDPSEASLILVRGTFSVWKSKYSQAKYKSASDLMLDIGRILEDCAKLDLPMLVTNPDFYRPGSNSPMPGLIARKYLEIHPDAKVQYIGKPYETIYGECLSVLSSKGNPVDLTRICCIGDSLEHDILGAQSLGCDSIWISNGVHCRDLGTEEGSVDVPDEKLVQLLLQKNPEILPTYIIPSFKS